MMKSRFERFKAWFFKGRIDKKIKEEGRIEELSKEYNDGKILEYGKDN